MSRELNGCARARELALSRAWCVGRACREPRGRNGNVSQVRPAHAQARLGLGGARAEPRRRARRGKGGEGGKEGKAAEVKLEVGAGGRECMRVSERDFVSEAGAGEARRPPPPPLLNREHRGGRRGGGMGPGRRGWEF